MNIQGKVWGETSSLFCKNNVEIHRIVCKESGYCSKHKHLGKYNMFFVEEGKIMVRVWKNDYDLVDETTITKGQSCVIKPGEFHQFIVLKDSVVYEIYWVELSESDIERDQKGGFLGTENADYVTILRDTIE